MAGEPGRGAGRVGPADVRMLVLDCDGVLTDGGLLYTPDGEVMQRFSIYDGHGVKCLLAAGVEVAILTGRTSAALARRAENLGVKRVVQGAGDKAKALRELAGGAGLDLCHVGFVGDELLDIGAMRLAGWSAAPASARPEVRAEAAYTCECRGGDGAVREIAEVILRARGAWPPPGTVGPAEPLGQDCHEDCDEQCGE